MAGAAGLRRLELHCPFSAPLQDVAFQPLSARSPGSGGAVEPQAGLQWLRVGVYPLSTALSLLRAHATTLEELQLVAASQEPYGCPDLHLQLASCGLGALKRLLLVRATVDGKLCRHDQVSCKEQKLKVWDALLETGVTATVTCSECG